MKDAKEQKIITRQVSRKLEALIDFRSATQGVQSWSEYVRKGLGMSLAQLAKRLGVTSATVSEAEKLEKEDRVTLGKLRRTADALNCDLVYAFVPRKKIEDHIKDQAIKKTLETLKLAETHMSLENQKVDLDQNERLKDLVEEKIYSKHLWD